ncbi:MAG: hypothetical protein PHD61_08170 [Bacteroidales bacterium]|nr:hypothetical protein [Lentimicrobiaceae bacterium]MDD5695266.1 hypothetical protein [Bacteroidales bacterium]
MKKLICLAFVTSFLVGWAQKSPYISAWQEKEFKVDGKAGEWAGLMFADDSKSFIYGISNDRENLYVKMKVLDESYQQSVLRNGITFWIDTTGKGKERASITFPIRTFTPDRPIQDQPDRHQRDPQGSGIPFKQDYQSVNRMLLTESVKIKSIGLRVGEKVAVDLNSDSNPLYAMMQMDSTGILVFEMRILLNSLFENPAHFSIEARKSFSYGFTVESQGSFPSPPGAGMGGPPQGAEGERNGMPPGEMGSMPGQMPGGGGMGQPLGGRPDLQSSSQPLKISVKKAKLVFINN